MIVLFDSPSRQIRDTTLTAPEAGRPVRDCQDIRARVSITSLGNGAELRVTLTVIFPDGATVTTTGAFRHVGFHELGLWRGDHESAQPLRVTGSLQAVGQVRFAAQLVAVEPGEDVL